MMIPGSAVRVHDVIRYLEPYPWVVVTKIVPYEGPLKDIVQFLFSTRPGCGLSVCYSDMIEVQISKEEARARGVA